MTDLLKLSDAIVLEYLQSKDKNLAKVFQQKTKAVSVNARRQVQRVRFGCTENGGHLHAQSRTRMPVSRSVHRIPFDPPTCYTNPPP